MIADPGRDVLQPDLAQLRKLTEIGRALTYTTSLEQVAQLAVERAASLVGATAAVLMLRDAGGLLVVRAGFAVSAERIGSFRAPLDDDLLGQLRALLDAGEERFLGVPLVVGGTVTGLVAVALPAAATPADEWLLSALADQVAVAAESARLGGEVRVELEDRLRASEGATNVKDRALATLAHDVRSPLGAIDGYCWNMEDGLYGPVSDQQRKTLGRIRMSTRHLLALLDNVLDMARLNAGVVPLTLEAVPLGDIADEAAEILAPAAAAKRQSLRGAPPADVVVRGAPDRIRQVLVNLLGNAVKFTPEDGRIAIDVGTRVFAGERWGEVVVSDSGPGIPAAEQAAVFEPYYRSEAATRLPGVGLGLAISHALATQMGGVLAVESAPGGGARFSLRLPLAVAGAGPA